MSDTDRLEKDLDELRDQVERLSDKVSDLERDKHTHTLSRLNSWITMDMNPRWKLYKDPMVDFTADVLGYAAGIWLSYLVITALSSKD